MVGLVAGQAPIAVVLTPVGVEFRAVREHLLDFRESDRVRGTIFYSGRLPRCPWQVVLVRPGPGNSTAAALAERAISRFGPELLLLVGIAGRLHTDLALGDIVVGTKIYAIHSGKEVNAGFRPRPETWLPDHRLVQAAHRLETNGTWRNAQADRPRAGRPKVVFRPIAAGDVVLDTKNSELTRRLGELYEDAAAIEMEGAGVGQACQLNKVPMMDIRAVSDHADGSKEESDQAGRQEPAARNAAAFAMAVLADVPPTSQVTAGRPPARQVLVSGSIPATPGHTGTSQWAAGELVAVGDREYLLVEGTLSVRSTAGGSAYHYTARGIQISPTPSPGIEHAWLRRIETMPGRTPPRSDLTTLATERELLTELSSVRGFPRLVRFVSDERSSTLVTGWPITRSTRLPCETLELIAVSGPRLDDWRTVKLCKGLAGLCQLLAVLHDRGRAHRYLAPAGIIRLDNDMLVLRDLGLAGCPALPGEGPLGYQAPEQLRRTWDRPGPPTDVYQVAALAYHLLGGQRPATNNPLPLRQYRGDLPEQVGKTVDAALNADPSARPRSAELGAAFGLASPDSPEERPCVS